MTDLLIIRPSSRPGPRPISIQAYMERHTLPEPNSGCWLWAGTLFPNGYGMVSHEKRALGVTRLAHRVSYELHCGRVPDGLVLDHVCRVRCCVNPAHLEPVTFAENCVRGVGLAKGQQFQRAKTHCPSGHAYDDANTRWRRDGSRACRECGRRRSLLTCRTWRARKKDEQNG